MIDKNLVLINYLNQQIQGYQFKSEYSTNDENLKVVVVSQRHKATNGTSQNSAIPEEK